MRFAPESQLIFENHLSERLFRRVRYAHGDIFHPHPIGNLLRLALQRHGWPSTSLSHYLYVHPAHAVAPSGSQSFHRRFLYRESSRVALVFVLELFAVGHFLQRVDASQKAVALRFNHCAYPRHFRDIDSHSYDHMAPYVADVAKRNSSVRPTLLLAIILIRL